MKAFELQTVRPRTLVLGSSRVEIGIDAADPLWPASMRPVYNLAISAGGPYIARRYLQNALSLEKVDLVIVGLDFEFFLGDPPSPQEKPEFARLRVSADGTPNLLWRRERIKDLLLATLSLDTLTDTVATVRANRAPYSSDMVSGDWRRIYFLHPEDFGGFYPRWMLEDVNKIPEFIGLTRNNSAMEDVKAIIELCLSHRTRVIFFINPYHADLLETFSITGHWLAFEQWKRDLLRLTESYSDNGNPASIPLWDFSDYDLYSTESVEAGQQRLKWYVSPSHYSPSLGGKLITSLLNPSERPFGMVLVKGNIDRHLAEIRRHQENYRATHVADAARIPIIFRNEMASARQN